MHQLRCHSAQNSASYVGFFLACVFSIFSHPANLCENDNKTFHSHQDFKLLLMNTCFCCFSPRRTVACSSFELSINVAKFGMIFRIAVQLQQGSVSHCHRGLGKVRTFLYLALRRTWTRLS